MDAPLLRKVDAVTVPVPDLDSGLKFYVGQLRHRLLWRNDGIGQAAVALREGDTEIVLTSRLRYEPNWLVDDVDEAVAVFEAAGGPLAQGVPGCTGGNVRSYPGYDDCDRRALTSVARQAKPRRDLHLGREDDADSSRFRRSSETGGRPRQNDGTERRNRAAN